MDFGCVSVLSTEDLIDLKKEVEKVLNARSAEKAQKIWDDIMTNFRALYDMGVTNNTLITDNETVEELFYQFHSKPEWEIDSDED